MRASTVLMSLLAGTAAAASEPTVTVYNGGFAVVRDHLAVNLAGGIATVRYPGASSHVEPGTALIALPAGIEVLEHTYRNDPVSASRLLRLFEGQVIDVEVLTGEGRRELRKARIVRAPAALHQDAWSRFGNRYAQQQQSLYFGGNDGANEVLLEIDGQLRFGLPGTPLFPALPADSDLRPTLEWQVRAAQAVQGPAEVSYLCDGMRWEAAYTLIAAAGDEDHVDLNGVISVENQSGTDFRGGRFKFVAGDVMKLDDEGNDMRNELKTRMCFAGAMDAVGAVTSVSARAAGKEFSDYHLYTMPDALDLRDRETKQLGFIDVHGVASRKRLVYDGLDLDWNNYRGWSPENIRTNREFATGMNPKVWIERLIENRTTNQLGKPLPAGVVRCYLKDSDGKPEFIGENRIDHTPDGERMHLYSGNAFDLTGERVQSDFACDGNQRTCDEGFRIVLRNHRQQPAEVTVVEHLYRGVNWAIRMPSTPFTKLDAHTIEFVVTVPANGELPVGYQAHYSW